MKFMLSSSLLLAVASADCQDKISTCQDLFQPGDVLTPDPDSEICEVLDFIKLTFPVMDCMLSKETIELCKTNAQYNTMIQDMVSFDGDADCSIPVFQNCKATCEQLITYVDAIQSGEPIDNTNGGGSTGTNSGCAAELQKCSELISDVKPDINGGQCAAFEALEENFPAFECMLSKTTFEACNGNAEYEALKKSQLQSTGLGDVCDTAELKDCKDSCEKFAEIVKVAASGEPLTSSAATAVQLGLGGFLVGMTMLGNVI